MLGGLALDRWLPLILILILFSIRVVCDNLGGLSCGVFGFGVKDLVIAKSGCLLASILRIVCIGDLSPAIRW